MRRLLAISHKSGTNSRPWERVEDVEGRSRSMLGLGRQSIRSTSVGSEVALDWLFLDILHFTHDGHDAASLSFVCNISGIFIFLDFSGL